MQSIDKNQHKKFGILELGLDSTAYYIQLFNTRIGHKNINSSDYLTVVSTNFDKINNLLPYASADLDAIIKKHLQELASLKIKGIIIPNITLHETIDKLWSSLNFDIPIAHPLFGTIKRMQKANEKSAILLGSKYTMNANYIAETFKNSGIKILKPTEEQQDFIDFVRVEVYQKKDTKKLLKKFNNLVASFLKESPVILACTELSIANTILDVNLFDFVTIQVDDLINLNK